MSKDSVVTVEDGKTICHVELNMPFPLMNLWSDSTSVHVEQPDGFFQRTWKLVRGTYRRNNIRPACEGCNSETGGALATHPKPRRRR